MPSLSITGGKEKFTWSINNLSSEFNTSHYKKAGITQYRFTQSASTIYGVIDSVDAPTNNSSKSTGSITVQPYSPGDYEFWGFAQAANGTYYPIGDSVSFTVTSGTNTIKATLNFNANGGSGAPSSVTQTGTSSSTSGYVTIRIPSTTPSRDGYVFDGWELSGSGSIYSPNSNITLYASTSGETYTLVAKWKRKGATPYIYVNGVWKPAKPYIYQNGSWVEASLYLFNNGWKPT